MACGIVVATAACASLATRDKSAPIGLTANERFALVRQSQIWSVTDVRSADMRSGPSGKGAFRPGDTVNCEYVPHHFEGKSPKFQCGLADGDEVKVKFGRDNGEVYGEVAGTRLLWALGFGADRMYPVRIICHGCPSSFHGAAGREAGVSVFEIAAIERKAPGESVEMYDHQGWSWSELDLVTEAAGGASRAERDALKLLAVFMQYGDNKAEQQRLVCRDQDAKAAASAKHKGETPSAGEPERMERVGCREPFMMLDDLGLTFGGVDMLDRQAAGSVNFALWSTAPVWKDTRACIGNLSGSLRGSLHDPEISEAGRAFLATLLGQLSDAQIHDLFDVAQFQRRPSDPSRLDSKPAPLEAWVATFKRKRREIADRRCNGPYVLQERVTAAAPALLSPPARGLPPL